MKTFFFRNTLLLGRKLKTMRLNSSEEFSFFFFLEITMILGQNLFLVRESQTIFIRNVLENHDLGKRYKIWEKLHCPPNFFCWYAYATN